MEGRSSDGGGCPGKWVIQERSGEVCTRKRRGRTNRQPRFSYRLSRVGCSTSSTPHKSTRGFTGSSSSLLSTRSSRHPGRVPRTGPTGARSDVLLTESFTTESPYTGLLVQSRVTVDHGPFGRFFPFPVGFNRLQFEGDGYVVSLSLSLLSLVPSVSIQIQENTLLQKFTGSVYFFCKTMTG